VTVTMTVILGNHRNFLIIIAHACRVSAAVSQMIYTYTYTYTCVCVYAYVCLDAQNLTQGVVLLQNDPQKWQNLCLIMKLPEYPPPSNLTYQRKF
jgi:hypothetical protein